MAAYNHWRMELNNFMQSHGGTHLVAWDATPTGPPHQPVWTAIVYKASNMQGHTAQPGTQPRRRLLGKHYTLSLPTDAGDSSRSVVPSDMRRLRSALLSPTIQPLSISLSLARRIILVLLSQIPPLPQVGSPPSW
ncbi:hypothetical protein PYCCODRAFT_1468721 [Trametes coccinea BRFM310]|uniref:Uncharacterized protein n=1 Tax=Trametes coccinea (strain BRFM310) TaxID=1353009 RepID=A0A1Y2IKZ5_TRAC3|nr:hypothetical protein PYCCODRAFT_1468721 [Trametes coccinea BRFM310]